LLTGLPVIGVSRSNEFDPRALQPPSVHPSLHPSGDPIKDVQTPAAIGFAPLSEKAAEESRFVRLPSGASARRCILTKR